MSGARLAVLLLLAAVLVLGHALSDLSDISPTGTYVARHCIAFSQNLQERSYLVCVRLQPL